MNIDKAILIKFENLLKDYNSKNGTISCYSSINSTSCDDCSSSCSNSCFNQ